jgi:hypothetical protein
MRTFALMACLALVAACGAKEEAAPSTDGPGATPGKTTMEDVKKDMPDVNAKVPAGAEMRTVVLDIEGMT